MPNDIAAYLKNTLSAPHWSRIGMGHHHGIAVPLFSIRSHQSCGIGDFGDLIPLIDWCSGIGLDCIQLLPLNDTGDDPSPYNPLSSCALDPIYLNLRNLPHFPEKELAVFTPLNELPRLSRIEVKHQKIKLLYKYFEQTFANLKSSKEYLDFIHQNPWLSAYALFKACKDEYGGKNWNEWPIEKQSLSSCTADAKLIDFHQFLQFYSFQQMQTAKRYAEKKKIFLKGDIPILLSPDSVDVWANRHLFDMHYSAGAPPDYYNLLGQKWGFPLFRWDEMKKTHFAWWQQRLTVASNLFHIYRIDHVVGLFRIWAIGPTELAADGRYLPEDPNQWEAQGREILEMMIKASNLLPMAEDLGASIPQIVYDTLKKLGICGTKVMRWVKRDDGSFVPGIEYDPISLTTVSTCDSETLSLWWKTQMGESARLCAEKHWTYQPHLAIWQLKELLKDSHHSASLFHINLLQEYLALFPSLIWPNPEDERINIPGTLSPINWTYRYKPFLEEIISHRDLTKEMQNIIR